MALSFEEAEAVIVEFCKTYPQALTITFNLAQTQEEIYGPENTVALRGRIAGSYRAASGGADFALANCDSNEKFETTLRHEILGHFGINTFNPSEKRAVLNAIIEARSEVGLETLWGYVDRLYPALTDMRKAEEVYAFACEAIDPSDRSEAIKGQQSYDDVCVSRTRAMRISDLINLTTMVAEGLHDRTRSQQTFPTDDSAQFKQDFPMKTSEFPVWLAVPPDDREKMRAAAGLLDSGRAAVAWDKEEKLWYARPGCDLNRIQEWLPDRSVRAGGGDPEAEFLDVLTQAGLIIKGMPVMNGKPQSVRTVESKSGRKSGVYCGYLDRRPGGWFINYHRAPSAKEVTNWSASGGKADPVARLHIRAAAKQSQEDSARERAANYARQTRIAKKLYDRLPAADPSHPYLVRKGIPPTPDLRQTRNGALVVPFFNASGTFQSLQYIRASGDKRLFKGAPKQGHFQVVGSPLQAGQPILYAEGYATARSLNLATGHPVVMTIDAGNMVAVAQILHQQFPNSQHLLMADFDHAKAENKGLLMATEAASKVGGQVLYPAFNESEIAQGFTDFNDLHHSRGLDALREQIASFEPSFVRHEEIPTMSDQSNPQTLGTFVTPGIRKALENEWAALQGDFFNQQQRLGDQLKIELRAALKAEKSILKAEDAQTLKDKPFGERIAASVGLREPGNNGLQIAHINHALKQLDKAEHEGWTSRSFDGQLMKLREVGQYAIDKGRANPSAIGELAKDRDTWVSEQAAVRVTAAGLAPLAAVDINTQTTQFAEQMQERIGEIVKSAKEDPFRTVDLASLALHLNVQDHVHIQAQRFTPDELEASVAIETRAEAYADAIAPDQNASLSMTVATSDVVTWAQLDVQDLEVIRAEPLRENATLVMLDNAQSVPVYAQEIEATGIQLSASQTLDLEPRLSQVDLLGQQIQSLESPGLGSVGASHVDEVTPESSELVKEASISLSNDLQDSSAVGTSEPTANADRKLLDINLFDSYLDKDHYLVQDQLEVIHAKAESYQNNVEDSGVAPEELIKFASQISDIGSLSENSVYRMAQMHASGLDGEYLGTPFERAMSEVISQGIKASPVYARTIDEYISTDGEVAVIAAGALLALQHSNASAVTTADPFTSSVIQPALEPEPLNFTHNGQPVSLNLQNLQPGTLPDATVIRPVAPAAPALPSFTYNGQPASLTPDRQTVTQQADAERADTVLDQAAPAALDPLASDSAQPPLDEPAALATSTASVESAAVEPQIKAALDEADRPAERESVIQQLDAAPQAVIEQPINETTAALRPDAQSADQAPTQTTSTTAPTGLSDARQQWARSQPWFDGEGHDDKGAYVRGRELAGNRVQWLFRTDAELMAWAEKQRPAPVLPTARASAASAAPAQAPQAAIEQSVIETTDVSRSDVQSADQTTTQAAPTQAPASSEALDDAILVGPRRGIDEPKPDVSHIDKDLLLTRLTNELQGDKSMLYKLDNEPAFVDRGARLEMVPGAGQSDEKIMAALLTAAQFYRGEIELTGSAAFKAKAIELIVQHRVNVKMKTPEQRAMLDEARKAYSAPEVNPDAIRGDTPPLYDPAPPVAPIAAAPVQPEPIVTQPAQVQAAPAQPVAAQKDDTAPLQMPEHLQAPDPVDDRYAHYEPAQALDIVPSAVVIQPPQAEAASEVAKSAARIDPSVHASPKAAEHGITGKVIDHGEAPFRFDSKNQNSVYITMRTRAGTQTFWGKELAGLLRETRIEPGRMATLKWLGQQPVVVQAPVKNPDTGVVVRYEEKSTHRNQWSLALTDGTTVRTGDDQGVKMVAYDAARFHMVQESIAAQLPIQTQEPAWPRDGLYWMAPNGQGSAIAGDALSAPRPTVDAQAAGTPIISSWSADGQLDMALYRSDGPYLQGVVRHAGEYQHVLVSLPDRPDAPPMVINAITEQGLVPIGVGNGINRSGGESVARDHIAFELEGDTAVRIAKLDFPADVPPQLHHRLGFDERWKDTQNLPKSAPAPAPQAQPSAVRPS